MTVYCCDCDREVTAGHHRVTLHTMTCPGVRT